jgi:hypothetical protein
VRDISHKYRNKPCNVGFEFLLKVYRDFWSACFDIVKELAGPETPPDVAQKKAASRTPLSLAGWSGVGGARPDQRAPSAFSLGRGVLQAAF